MIEKNSKVVLHLSKPWAMGEALHWASLPASIDRREGERWLVELEQPVEFGGTEYRYFVLAPRLEGWHLSDAVELEVPCSMTPTAGNQLSPATDPGNGTTGIVGSITELH